MREPYIVRHIRDKPDEHFDYDKINFLVWMTNVEKIVLSKINLTLDDLEDELYRINFDEGMSSNSMSKIVLKNCHMNFS